MQTDEMTAEQFIDRAQTALNDANKYPCAHKKDGKQWCMEQHDWKLDKDDRPVFFFGIDCKVAKTFCPACLAYWCVAVARNALFDFARFAAQDTAAAKRAFDGAIGRGGR